MKRSTAWSISEQKSTRDNLIISEKDKKLHIKINLNAKFERHKDCYDEEGNLTESVFIAQKTIGRRITL